MESASYEMRIDSTKDTQPRTMGSFCHAGRSAASGSARSSTYTLLASVRTETAQPQRPRIMTPSSTAEPPMCVWNSSPESVPRAASTPIARSP